MSLPIGDNGYPYVTKDPNGVLDYVWDFAAESNGTSCESGDWLSAGEVISIHQILLDTDLNLITSELISGGTAVRAWIGSGVLGNDYAVTCRIQTNSSPQRITDRTLTLRIRDR